MPPSKSILLLATYELGHQPFNLASPLAALAEAGLPARAVDTGVEPLPATAVREASFIGISVPMHTATRLAARLIEGIRAINPSVALCCYGLYAFLNTDYLLECGADYIIAGEYEAPLRDLVVGLVRGRTDPPPGVTTRQHKAAPHLEKISFVTPDRRALPPLKHYAHLEWNGQRSPAGYVEASRGCLHTCLHCPVTPVYGGRFFVVPAEVVLADIRAQVERGARHITFGDPDFLNGPGHSLQIVRALHAEFPQVTFDITVKIEHILKHRRHFAELKALGCAFVVSAVESFSDEVLRRLDKGHTRADIEVALDILAGAGISLRPSLVAFTPWTTFEDYLEMLEQVERLGLIEQIDPVQYSIRLLLPPHSALLPQAAGERWLGPLQPAELSYAWQHPDPRMDALHRQVAGLVAIAADVGEDTRTTFYRVRDLARGRAGGNGRASGPELEPDPGPRLTESWFC
ncbi:MAG: CUAEP/CCAEP-tail radical SAM (seleno)protein [Anaerolineae bacterium]